MIMFNVYDDRELCTFRVRTITAVQLVCCKEREGACQREARYNTLNILYPLCCKPIWCCWCLHCGSWSSQPTDSKSSFVKLNLYLDHWVPLNTQCTVERIFIGTKNLFDLWCHFSPKHLIIKYTVQCLYCRSRHKRKGLQYSNITALLY